MFSCKSPVRVAAVCAALFVGASAFGPSAEAALRIATWNVASDVDRNNSGGLDAGDGTFAVPYIVAGVQAMAARNLAGNVQPLDVITLQELYDNGAATSITLTSTVTALNNVYGAGTYAAGTAMGANTGFLPGNGPNGVIYNTKTVSLLATQQIGTASGSGAPRTPMRYQLRATGYTGANTFYVYNEHAKALGGAENLTRRTIEADAVRSNADALPAGAHAIFTGDFNYTGGSSETAYKDLAAAPGTLLASGATAGPVGQAFDPLTSTFTTNSNTYAKYYTESADDLTARFDLQLVTGNTLSTDYSAGLKLLPGTYTAFGNSYYNAGGIYSSVLNNGSSIFTTANYNTALTGYTQEILNNLLLASDHLPVLADYTIAVPEPGAMAAVILVAVVAFRRSRGRAV